MPQNDRLKALMAAFEKTAYFRWMRRQGIPVVDGYGVEDVREMQLAPWSRIGGRAAFVNLYGMEGVTGMYVAEKSRPATQPGPKVHRHFTNVFDAVSIDHRYSLTCHPLEIGGLLERRPQSSHLRIQ